jgi:oligopeptide transport system substrate-binding protein
LESQCTSNRSKRQIANLVQNRFELGYSCWISYLNDPVYNLGSFDAIGEGFFKNGWNNQKYSDLLEASNNEGDPHKRKELLKSAEELIMTEMPCIPIIEKPPFYAKQNNLQEDFST